MAPVTASPFTALTLLLMFKQRRYSMTHAQFDLYVGTIVELLEEVHNERYRLDQDQEEK